MCLLMVSTLSGQIKIGDNPQNIDPTSVLELESTSRVLVITRVTDAQMNSITPLKGALVYNTDQECVHYYNGIEWINICEAFDDSFTVSTNAIFNPFANDSTVVVTQTDTNYNFEVNQITGDNIVDTSINGANEIQQGSITGLQLSDATITFDKLADGENTGDLLRWNGNEWVLVDETAITVTELDGVVGNEVTGPADTTLELSGAGDELSPYLLDVSAGGIGTNELADNAVNTDKILDGEVNNSDIADNAINSAKIEDGQVDTQDIADDAITIIKMGLGSVGTDQIVNDAVTRVKIENGLNPGELMQWDGSNWVLVNETALNITEADGVIGNEVTGPADTTLELSGAGDELSPYLLDVSVGGIGNNELGADAVTTDKIAAGAVESTDIAAGAVNAATINNDVAGAGLAQNLGTGALEVDVTSLTGDGSITSSDLTVTGGANATLNNVTLEIAAGAVGNNELDADAVTTDKIAAGAVESTDIAAGAVNAATINNDVAGAGLAQNLGTGALEVDVTSLTGDGSITSSDLTVTGGANATLNNVALEIAAGVITNADISATAAIDGSKINPVFVADVTTTGDFIDLTPDFVFEKYYNGFSDLNNDYIFKSLEEVESFLKKHHHLPGIRSAYDIKASGVYRLTESSLGQLEKIEELFLHTIEQEKKIEKLATENEKLSNELNLLKVEMENIKTMLLQKAQE